MTNLLRLYTFQILSYLSTWSSLSPIFRCCICWPLKNNFISETGSKLSVYNKFLCSLKYYLSTIQIPRSYQQDVSKYIHHIVFVELESFLYFRKFLSFGFGYYIYFLFCSVLDSIWHTDCQHYIHQSACKAVQLRSSQPYCNW